MASLAVERLESALQARRFDRTLLSRRIARASARRLAPTGWPALDAALGGGWSRGEVSELAGPRASGRTRVLLATLAAATRRGEVVGLVDTFDRFDPRSAVEAGVVLDRVLWVRGPGLTVEHARHALVEEGVLRALRAIDLIVRAGGFAVAALDLADVPSRAFRVVPPAAWLRLAHTNEGRDTAVLLLGEAPMGRSAGGVSLRLSASSRWTGTRAQSHRLAGLDICVDVMGARPGVERWPLGACRPSDRTPTATIQSREDASCRV